MHIAIARVHVQRNEHSAAHHLRVDFAQARHDFGVCLAAENFSQRRHHIRFNGHTQPEIAKGDKAAFGWMGFGRGVDFVAITRLVIGKRRVQIVQQPLPARLHLGNVGSGIIGTLAQQIAFGQAVKLFNRQAA